MKYQEIGSTALANAGYYFIRRHPIYLAISCGGNNPSGQHTFAHNDKLSFELNVSGKDIFIDPGTYCLNSTKLRNTFRSGRQHNTIMVNSTEMNHISDDRMLELFDNTNAQCVTFEKENGKDVFLGEHYGYQKLMGVIHQRRFVVDAKNQSILIEDHLIGSEERTIEFIYHLSPDVSVTLMNNQFFLLKSPPVELALRFDLHDFELEIVPSCYASGFYTKQPTRSIVLRKTTELPLRCRTALSF